ncbi:MAG TPA: FtsX-like permease family protein [Aliidongia sp.]|uniref:ABC transporter permease n=1 Tax=Aliidongia sp. TaxID=1914230 RepID=UPI002DDDBB03|nr:FtsX-like permease family protein [Aliidongia sp.]HEV2678702.1 FtsX-like permease family protein [Aliidongia sp.]
MSLLFKIAFRNILRNRRRSAMTGSAVAAGALAMLLFGGFTTYIFAGLETNNVQRIGHLTVFRAGYFLFGAGNPAAYGIDRYGEVMKLIGSDPVLKPMINVLTPTQSLVGIAGNFSDEVDASKTFLGVGLIPSDRDRMRLWDQFEIGAARPPDHRLSDTEETSGLMGFGLARILGLCARLGLADCPPLPDAGRPAADITAAVDPDIVGLARHETSTEVLSGAPQIQLLAATAGGAPNVVSLSVNGAEPQGVKELDDNYIAMHLALAQQLVYGRGEHKVTGIVLQLHRSQDLQAARARLVSLFQEHRLDLDIRDFSELTPFYGQVVRLFSGIFLFIALVMSVIVLFAVVNTMTMNVMERTNEIGTTRAMGVRRARIRWQFILEGALIGVAGATAGAILAVGIASLVNGAGLTWVPPGNANPSPLYLYVFGRPGLVIGAWLGLVLIATLAALIPANRAARLPVVDALRHV